MRIQEIEGLKSYHNPVDVLEAIFDANEWPFDRHGENEIAIETTGGWCDQRILFIWQEDYHCLYFTCRMDLRVSEERRQELDHLLSYVNSNMWMGHFDLCPEDGAPTFRHAIPLRGMGCASPELIEDLIDVALGECERFYPAFQLVLWGNYDCESAVRAAMLECQGEA